MEFDLVVIRPFGGLAIGELINDRGLADTVLGGEHAACVVRVTRHPMSVATDKES